MHLGEEDEFISKTAQGQIKAALAKKPKAIVHSYSGQRHTFSRHNGAHYNAKAAAFANERTHEFLHQQLRLSSRPCSLCCSIIRLLRRLFQQNSLVKTHALGGDPR